MKNSLFNGVKLDFSRGRKPTKVSVTLHIQAMPLREKKSRVSAAKGGQEMPREKSEQAEHIAPKLREDKVEVW